MTDVTPAPGDRLRAALSGASTVAPDEAARAQNRARQIGAPRSSLVGLPQNEWPSTQQNFDVEGFLRDFPRTASYLERPDNAQVAGDRKTREQLGGIERNLTRNGFNPRPGDTLQPLRRPNTPGQWARGLWAGLTSGEAWEGAQLQLGDALGLWRNPSERAAAVRDYESAAARIEMARPEVNGAIGQGIYGGLESTARMLPATALSVVLRNPAPLLATAGATTETAAYGKYSARGATGTEATIGAAGEGAVEVLTELIPMGAFVRALGAPTAKRFITEIGASVLSDAAGEQIATLAQDAIDTAIANPDKTWGEYLAERPDAAAQTLVSSLTQSLLMSGGAAGVRATGQFIDSRMQQAAEVETDASTITNLVEGARASDLRGRSSESFAEFVAQASEGGPVENLYVAAEALNQSGVDIAALRAAVPAIDQQIEQATKDGGDIQIPVEQFAANAVEIDGVDGLVDHMRINPALPSRAEVSALAQEQTGEVQAEAARIIADATTQDAFRQSAERVETGMFDQLQTAGRFSRDVNRSYASLVGSFYTVQAQRLGITPEQMAERYPLRIAAELPQATRAETLDQVEQDRIQLVHYSRSPGLVESDPTRWGSNRATPQSERNRTANAPGRTYFYDRAARPTPETSIAKTAPFRYGASVLRSALYDFDADPQGLRPVEGADTASAYENAIRDAGFAGYFSNAVVEGAIAVFDPMPLRAEGLVQTVQQAQAVERKQEELQQAERRARQAGNPEIVASKPLADFRNEALREVFPDAALLAPIEGAPKSVKVDGERIKIEPFPPAREAAAAYMASQGLRYEPPRAYAAVDTGRATRLAEAFDGMAHAPNDPVVRAAYNAMIEETLAQYQFVKATGLEIEFIQGADPYAASPRLATKDVVENNHLWVFPTDDGFGGSASAGIDVSGNPLLAPVGEWIGDRQLLANDVFRIVHDYFGHVKDGFGFRADGEENAWQSHAAMYSPLARRAMTTETRGQNSWVNYGPFGAFNKTANAGETQYAPQKIGLLPSWADTDGFLGGEQSGTAAGVLYQAEEVRPHPAFYSALSRAVAKSSTTKAPPSQWLATVRKTPGVKAEEIEWSGLEEWLALATTDEFAQVPFGMANVPLADSKGNVTREAVLAFLENGGVQVEETVLSAQMELNPDSQYHVTAVMGALRGARDREDAIMQLENDGLAYRVLQARFPRLFVDQMGDEVEDWAGIVVDDLWRPTETSDGPALFSQYKLPGADETYRELLLTLPRIDGPSTHWDQQNVVAHVRLTSRQDASGAKVLFLEEVQSDWHQKGRDEGYQQTVDQARVDELLVAEDAAVGQLNTARERVSDAVSKLIDQRITELVAVRPEAEAAGGSVLESINGQIDLLEEADQQLGRGIDPFRILNQGSLALVRSPAVEQAVSEFSVANLRATELRQDLRNARDPSGIPNAPFQKSWPQLAMKRMISYAVENGFDKVAWINGNQQNGGQTGGDGSFFYERNLVNLTNEIIKKVGGKVERVTVDLNRNVESFNQLTRSAASDRADADALVQAGEETRAGGLYGMAEAGDLAAQSYQNYGFAITEQMKAQAAEGFALFQRNRGQIAFGTDITQTPSVISLLQTADLSTFLHETGHFFLEVTRDMASRPDAPTEIKADMDTLLGWFGVSDLDAWSKMGWEEKRRYHEQFARGFEAYLFEGRAPTPRLRELFQRFRSWLLNVYRSLTQLNVELTDDVRGVLGRMVAAEDEITAATSGYGLTPLAEKPPYMDDASWADYQAAFANAEQEGVDTLTTRSVRDMKWLSNARSRALRRLQSEARQQRQQVKAEVTAEVMAEPVNRARAYIRRGVGPDGEVVPGAVKLDRAALEQMFGTADDAVWRSLRTGGKYGEVQADGVHPDVAAEMFGYDSGDALVRDMASAEDANEKIAGMTDQRMLERYGEMADQAALERAADEAIANDAHVRAIATDYAALAAATGQPRALAAAAREHAASIINRIELRRLKPHQFFAAMTRAGKAADKAARSGDLAKAAQYRRAQLINLQAAKYALEAKAEVDKALTRFTRIVSANDEALARSRDMALVNAARAILSAYSIGRVKNDPASYLERVKTYDPQLFADIQPFVDGATGQPKPIDQISYEQFQGLRDTVNQLWVLSRRTRQIELDGVLVDIDTARDALGARLDALGYATPVGQDERPSLAQEFQRKLQGARAALRRVESWTRAVDAADFGPFRTYVWNPVSTAADRYRIAQGEYLRRFLDLVKPIEASLTTAKIGAAEIGYTFTGKAELLHAVLHSGNTSNLSKLLLGRRWGKQTEDGALDTTRWDAFLERAWAEGILTQADYDFAQGVWDLMDATKPAAQAAHRAMYGRYFSEVTAQPITTPWGEYRGGYVPATTDSFLVRDAQLREEQNALEDSNAFMFPAASNGFTKSRVEDYTRELSLDIRLLPMHIDKVLKFTHLGPPVRDVARVLRGRAFAEKLDAFDPVITSDLLLPWLQRSARQVVQEPMKGQGGRLVDGFFRELRSRTGMQIMFANLSNVLQQVTGFSNAAVRVKPSRLAAGMWNYVRDPKGTTEAVTGLSEFMAGRTTSQVFEMRQTIEQLLLNPSKYEKVRDFSQRHAYFAQFALQNITDLSVWTAAYNQSLERGDSDRDAVRFADSVIRETQGSMSPEDISRFETGTAFSRMFTQFYSYFNNQTNLLGTGVLEITRTVGAKKGAGQLFYLYVTGMAIPALLAQALADLAKGGWEDDEDDGYLDEFLAWFFGSQAKFALAALPVVGQVANAALGGFTPQAYDDRVSTSPAISMIESSARLPGAYAKAIAEGEPLARRDVRDTMNFLGLLTGLPLGAAGRPASYGYGVATGDVEPTSAFDAARGAVTGAPSKESLGR